MLTIGTVGNLIKDEPDAKIRASVKGVEIAKLGPMPRQSIGDFDIEVVSMNAIPGGVEVFARAWTADGQSGFGQDGSVDIERFRIFNPPILVPDGTTTLTTDERTGEPVLMANYAEDLGAAVLLSLAHTIKVKKEKRGAEGIVPGKVGNTTSTFYPAAGAASPVDGAVGYDGVYDTTFSALRTGTAANQALVSDAAVQACHIEATTTPNQYKALLRGVFCFDTSAIGSDIISSAVFSLYGNNSFALVTTLGAFDLHVCEANPAATNNLVTADYDLANFGSTSFGSIGSGSIVEEGAYNDITLDANGRANIETGGVTKYGTRSSFDINNSAPTWVSGAASYWYVKTADTAGTTSDPKLVVEHAAPVTKTVTDTLALTSATIKSLTRKVLDTLTLSTAISALRGLNKTVTDTLTLSSTILRSLARTITDTLTLTTSRIISLARVVTDTLTLTTIASSIRQVFKTVTDTLQLTSNVRKILNGAFTIWSNIAKNVASWTAGSKNTTTWDNEDKSS